MKRKNRKRMICCVICTLLLLLSGCRSPLLLSSGKGDAGVYLAEETSEEEREEEGKTEIQSDVYVHVCGCVKKPGLYCLPGGDRVKNAVDAAGGFSKEADQTAWNLAMVVTDGMQIYVPSVSESPKDRTLDFGVSGKESGNTDRLLVNINTATKEELMTLSGIGQRKAEDIIAYREDNGAFTKIEEIRNVSGIGDGIFNRIKEYITVS